MVNRVEQVLSPEGRQDLLEEIRAIREAVQSADRIIASLIDRYLEEYGTSLDELQDYASDLFEEEDESDEEAG
jgi:recombinational DNA repair protein (RecF pathway)